MERTVKWLEELRQEARLLEKTSEGTGHRECEPDDLDEMLSNAAESWDTPISAEVIAILSDVDAKGAVRPLQTTRFLYSALYGYSLRSVRDTDSVPFPRLVADRAAERGLDAPVLAKTLGLIGSVSDFSSDCFIPWRLSPDQVLSVSRLLGCTIPQICDAIRATEIVPRTAAALTRPDSSACESETDTARLISEHYMSLKRQLEAKERLLGLLEQSG